MITRILCAIVLAVMAGQVVALENAKIMLNQKETAYIGIYSTPDNSVRWVKTITRKQLNDCLAQYTPSQRKQSRYINHCLCRLKFGARRCNL